MFQDFNDLLCAFRAHSVRYLSVGGYAVSLHAQPRATKVLDLFIKAEEIIVEECGGPKGGLLAC